MTSILCFVSVIMAAKVLDCFINVCNSNQLHVDVVTTYIATYILFIESRHSCLFLLYVVVNNCKLVLFPISHCVIESVNLLWILNSSRILKQLLIWVCLHCMM